MQRDELSVLKEVALKAGTAVKKAEPSEGIITKEGRANFVTAADLASEKIIMDEIHESFPSDKILSEETENHITELLSEPHLWVIDPIDGTNNFRFGRNYSAVSIGYVENGVLKGAAVYDPFNDDLFTAEKGKGAFLNGTKIQTSSLESLAEAVIATDNSYDPAGTKRNLEIVLRMPVTPWCLMRGSAVLTMCDAASGRIDLYFHNSLKPWDNAAAFLIAEEAGALVVGIDGQEISFLSEHVIIGNHSLVDQFLASIK
jgi:myo-inositol-1(or 4)-monophosphatase